MENFSQAFSHHETEIKKKHILLFPVNVFCCYYNTRRIHIISPNIHTLKVLTLLTHFYSARNFSNKFNHLSKDINGMNTHMQNFILVDDGSMLLKKNPAIRVTYIEKNPRSNIWIEIYHSFSQKAMVYKIEFL